jgi:hypothetical protein
MTFSYLSYSDDYNLDIFPPSQVTGLVAIAGNGEIALTWVKPATGGSVITDFTIQQSIDDATWSTIVDGVSSIASYTVTGLDNGTLYYFKVSASNISGAGDYSTSKSATPSYTTGKKLISFPEVQHIQGVIRVRGNTRLPLDKEKIVVRASAFENTIHSVSYKGVVSTIIEGTVTGKSSRNMKSKAMIIGSKLNNTTESITIKGKKDYIILINKIKQII